MISIPGATEILTPDDKPSIGVYGVEGTGKTRFAATAPGPIGLLALDKKSKRTFMEVAGALGTQVLVNDKPLMSDSKAIEMAMATDDAKGVAEIKQAYDAAVAAVLKLAMAYAKHPEIRTIVVDTASQLFDWILFKHFGRRNQIQPVSRAGPNQEMIDFVNTLRSKNLVLIHRSKEIWKPTGATDGKGNPIREPSGKFEADGFKNIGGFLTANIELTSKKVATDLDTKFRAKVTTSQMNVLMEGQDLHQYGVSGADITWTNITTILGLAEE